MDTYFPMPLKPRCVFQLWEERTNLYIHMLINNTFVCLDGTAYCILYVWMRSPYGSNLVRSVSIEIAGKLDVDVPLHPHKNEHGTGQSLIICSMCFPLKPTVCSETSRFPWISHCHVWLPKGLSIIMHLNKNYTPKTNPSYLDVNRSYHFSDNIFRGYSLRPYIIRP